MPVKAAFERLTRLWTRPCSPWIAIFLAANLVIHPDYGTNPESRFAALCAMVEDHSFRIDHYKDLTIDWARTPDGHYYSNKAPGPMLLGFPVFWVMDKVWTAGAAGVEPQARPPQRAQRTQSPRRNDLVAERTASLQAARDGARIAHAGTSLAVLSLLFQALPFALLVALAAEWLEGVGASPGAIHLACAAMLFGNTASLFMNTYFGHGMAAVCVLALCLCLIKRWYVWAGLAYGWALLADYSSAVLLPGFLAAALTGAPPGGRLRALWKIGLGGLLPGVLWVWYHVACFGGPFTLPGKYQNPMFVDAAHDRILGLFSLAPNPVVAARLLGGFDRGILWSQPWLLVVVILCLVWGICLTRRTQYNRGLGGDPVFWPAAAGQLLLFLLPGLLLLLWMNASFGKWEGGATPGPRYMCSVFPAFGLLGGLLFDKMFVWMRRLLVGGVVFAVVFWILAFSTQILVPEGRTIWGYTFHWLIHPSGSGPIIRVGTLVLVFEWQLWRLLFDRRNGAPVTAPRTENVPKPS